LRFDCRWTTGGLFKLFFLNSLGVIATAGLLAPWAAVRTARYQLKRISLQPGEKSARFIAAAQERVGAIGDEAGDLLDSISDYDAPQGALLRRKDVAAA